MAMELMSNRQDSYNSRIEELAAKEAAKAGFQSVETLLTMLTQNSPNTKGNIDCLAVADVAVTQFRKFISVLDRNRTGHARFRLGPVKVPRAEQEPKPELVKRLPPLPYKKEITKTISFAPGPTMSTSFMSSLTGDTESCNEPSMSSSGFHITNMSRVSSSIGRPPLPAVTLKRKCGSVDGEAAPNCGSRCHCSKKRKSRLKKVVRIPAISSKLADIPPDDFSWRKYGQKPIKGSPHPRLLQMCSTMRSCPARKHVERASDDPTMLIVTYEGEHSHSQSATKAPSSCPRIIVNIVQDLTAQKLLDCRDETRDHSSLRAYIGKRLLCCWVNEGPEHVS